MFNREDLTPPGSDEKYLIRWTLWRGRRGRALYLHHIVGSDWAREPHDHPKDFTVFGLFGGYKEEEFHVVKKLWINGISNWKAPWFRRFPAEHIHRLSVDKGKTAWTLVYVSARKQDWGFFQDDGSRELFSSFVTRKRKEANERS